ncbi:hypothetical protein HY504_00205 [Candidatus Wolfebacteria bacterium]|nr:hypothetical protein [Candidatus Wolfebacteria bacterium]
MVENAKFKNTLFVIPVYEPESRFISMILASGFLLSLASLTLRPSLDSRLRRGGRSGQE